MSSNPAKAAALPAAVVMLENAMPGDPLAAQPSVRPSAAIPPAGRPDAAPASRPPTDRELILAAVPSLRAFAMSLCRNGDRADDLVQDTLMRALSNIESFQSGTNMAAWLFTILRNQFRSEYRKRKREVEDVDGIQAGKLSTQPGQESHLEFEEFRTALVELPLDQREALILVGASGYSYDDAAKICGCAVGTIKSRVNRARARLAELMALDGAERQHD
jgi:RNA polymerase sigma factor (sigma-70 family)